MLNLAHGQASDPFAEPQRTSNRGATDQATSPDPFVVREAGATGADAEVRAETSQDNVAFLTEFVEVDRLALSDLFARGEVDLADGDALRAAVGKLVNEDKGKMIESCVHVSRGGRAKAEAIRELIYTVVWAPPASSPESSIPVVVGDHAYWPPASYPHPKQFDARMHGICTETRSARLPGGSLSLETAQELVRHLGESEYALLPAGNQSVPAVALPIFGTIRFSTLTEVPMSRCCWVGTSQREGHEAVMMFVTPHSMSRGENDRPPAINGHVGLVAEMIEVDAAWFREAVAPSGESWDSARLRVLVQDRLAASEAEVLAIGSLSGEIGKPMRSEAIRERMYPTEYDPPELPVGAIRARTERPFWAPENYPKPMVFTTRNIGMTVRATVHDRSHPLGFDIGSDA